MKKIFRVILKVAMCLFGIVILIIAGFRFEKAINELDDEMFKSYKCYDYHLTALKTTAKRSWILSSDDESKFYSVYARGIKGVPYKKFVRAGCTDGSFFYPFYEVYVYVYQNPDDYVDVLNDWTISKIEVFTTGDGYDTDDPQIDLGDRVIATSGDSAPASELVEFVKNDSYNDNVERPADYTRENFDKGQLRVRVHFKEAKYIVWESDIECYRADESSEWWIEFDKGEMSGKTANKVSASIGDLDKLYEFLSDAADKAASPT